MKMADGRWRAFLVAMVALLWTVLPAHAQTNYAIDWFKVAGGGGRSTNTQYTVTGTLGQHDAGGPMTNAQYSIRGGFWDMPVAVPQDTNIPALKIVPATPGLATVSWTPSTPGFVLQESLNLTSGWTNSASGATNPVTVPAVSPQKFYRLSKP